jgi:DNA topoisomerase-2
MSYSTKIFPLIDNDERLISYRTDDGETIEPYYFVPIIPFVLCNGAEGIGTGWSTSIIQFNPLEIIKKIKDLIGNKASTTFTFDLVPWWRGFGGTIKRIDGGWIISGRYKVATNGVTLIIYELPVSKNAKSLYDIKEEIKLLENEDKIDEMTDEYDEVTDNHVLTVKFKNKADVAAAITNFKLNVKFSKRNMVLFNKNHKITLYSTFNEMIEEWFEVRYNLYEKRISLLIELCEKKLLEISNKCLFIKLIIEEKLEIRNTPKKQLVTTMLQWFESSNGTIEMLLKLPINYLTKEQYEKLKEEEQETKQELERLKTTTVEELWLKELDELEKSLPIATI